MEQIDFDKFTKDMATFEKKMPDVDFVVEQIESPQDPDEILWVLEIQGDKLHFPTYKEMKQYLTKVSKEKKGKK